MMRILLLLLLLLSGVLLGPYLIGQKGYVLIAMDSLTIEMTVVSLGFVIFALLLVFLTLEWLIKLTYSSISGTQNWLGNLSLRKKHQAFYAGLQAIAAGDHEQAIEQLQKIQQEDFAGVNLLAQAAAEMYLDNLAAAKQLWLQAAQYPGARVAARLMLAKQLLAQQPEQAIEQLKLLDEPQQKHKSVVKIWVQALAQSGQWQQLNRQLPSWKKVLAAEYQHWQNLAATGIYAEIASKHGANQLKQSWQDSPRSTRKDPAQRAAYIQQLLLQGMHQDAEAALVQEAKASADPLLLPLYKQLQLPNPAAAIRQLEAWLRQDDSNGQLYSTLGHLAFNSGDMILAEKALSKAIALTQQQQDILRLAELKERQQDHLAALALYKQSVQQDKHR